jgi:hypothetical protein
MEELEPMNEETQKNVLAHLQARFDALPPGTVLVPARVCPICQARPCNAVPSTDETLEQQHAEQLELGFDSYEEVEPYHASGAASVDEDTAAGDISEVLDRIDVDEGVRIVMFGDLELAGGVCLGEFYVHPEDEDVCYNSCPLPIRRFY